MLFLRFLLALEPGGGLDPADIAISLWRRYPSVFGPDRVDGMVAVARAVGVVPTAGPVGLTSAARALLMSRFDDIEVADDTSFVVQADHTIVAPQSLRSDLASRLAALADVESEGGAVVWRLTDATVVRALDHGQTGDDIEAFLREHSTKEVPQSVVYFVHDVERRRGRLNIVEAATVVVSDDVALVAQAVRVAGAKLRAVGLHAAVSALPPASVEKALTAKGVLGVKVAAGAPKVTPTRVGLAAVGGPGSALAAPKTGKDLGALADLLTGRASRALARRIRKPST